MMINEDCITCPLCKNLFQTPIILPCGETVCKNCLPEKYKSSIFCSLCKELHKIPDNGFPVNKALEKTLQSVLNDEKINCLRKSKTSLLADMDSFRSEIDSAEVNIIDYCRSIINEIDLKTEHVILEVNNLREKLINKVIDYENLCLRKWKDSKDYFDSFLNSNTTIINENSFDSIKILSGSKCVEEFENLELMRSKIFYERSRLKSLVLNKTLMNFESSKFVINGSILGKLVLKDFKEVNPSNLNKICLKKKDPSEPEKKSENFQSEILDQNRLVVGYTCPDLASFFIEIYEIQNSKQINNFNENYEYSNFSFILKTYKDKVYVYKNITSSLLIFDEDLNLIEKKLIINSASSFLITEKYVFMFNSSYVNGGVLSVYDPNLNFLMSTKGNNFNSFIQFPDTINEMFKNQNFYFFRNENSITVVNVNDGKILKKLDFENCYEILKITDQNIFIVTSKCKSSIMFFDFNLTLLGQSQLQTSEISIQVKIFVDDNLNVKMFDPIKMNMFI